MHMQTPEQNRLRAKTWYEVNRERASASGKKRRAAETPEERKERLEYNRNYYQRNREQQLARQKEQYARARAAGIPLPKAACRIYDDPMIRMRMLVKAAKQRATMKKMEFAITAEDFAPLATVCPLLGIPIIWDGAKRTSNSPSIDRIDSSLGYVVGNVHVVSWRANMLKNNASLEELQILAHNFAAVIASNI